MHSSGGTSLNVLPVLTDLSPTPKSALPLTATGSSIDQFQNILDRTLSGTTSSGGMSAAPTALHSTPYVSPLKQSAPSEVERPPQQPPQADRAQSTRSHETARQTSEHSGGSRADTTQQSQTAQSSKRSSSANEGKASSSAAAQQNAEHSQTAAKKEAGKAAAKAEDAKKGKKAVKNKGKNPSPRHGSSTDIAKFPGAIILAGTKKTQHSAVAKAVEELAAAKAQAAKTTKVAVKGAQGKQVAAEQAVQKSKPAVAEASKKSKAAPPQLIGIGQLLTQALHGSSPTGVSQEQAAVNGPATQPNHSNISNGHPAHSSAETQSAGVTIIDLRHSSNNNATNNGSNNGQNHSQDSGNIRLFQLADGGSNTPARMTGQAGMVRASGAPAQGQSFQALTDQIVKQTGILLKDNNAGEIRLVLKPEHLGSLRIKIDMNNNNLTGKILVQNHDALRLVQQNLDNLYRALRDSGFTATELNVSVGGKDAGGRDKERSSPLPSARAIQGVRGFDSQTPTAPVEGSANNYSLVNLVI